ncbi:MAG TPA: peptidoglycan-binding domain-containing protein [Stenomitos sp.]
MISGVSNSPYRYRPQANAQAATAAPAADSSAIAARPQSKPVVQAGGGLDAASILDTVMNFLKSVGSFFVGLFNKIFKKGDTQPTPAPVDDNTLKLAQQYGLLPTKENVDAFVTEVQGYATPGPGGFQTLGPGSPDTESIKQIQTALKAWGYPAEVTGQYDSPTQAAVKAFKQANGLHQTYKNADGNFAVNEYLDYQTYQKMQEKANGGSTTTTPPTTTPSSGNGTLNWQAIATQYNLYATEENVNAFLAEVKGYQTPDAQGFKAIGPGYPNQDEIKEVQTALAKVGFQVAANGQWDAATSKAVMDFKSKYGLHQNYRSADGNWAINEYADKAMLQKLSSLVA